MKFYIGYGQCDEKTKARYIISCSSFCCKDEIEEYVLLIFVQDLIDKEADLDCDISIELNDITVDEYDSLLYNNEYKKKTKMASFLFGDRMNELIEIKSVEKREEQTLETYYMYELQGLPECECYSLNYENAEHSFDTALEEAYKDLLYQVRRYYPKVQGLQLYTAVIVAQEISQGEYLLEMERIEECENL